MVKTCTCEHKGQDKLHGNNQRVHTPITKNAGKGGNKWRCTVCLKEKE